MVAGDFLGGLLQGMAQGRARKQDLEEKKLMRGQREIEAKRKAAQEQFYMDLIRGQIGNGEETPTTPTSPSGADISGLTTTGETPQGEADIVQQIAQAQTGGATQGQSSGLENISPLIAALIKKGSGIDMPGALRIQGTQSQHQDRMRRSAMEKTYHTITNPDGSQGLKEKYKYPELRAQMGLPSEPTPVRTGGIAGSMGGQQTTPAMVERAITEQNIPLYLDENLDTPPVGTTIEEAQAFGFKRFDTGTKQRLQDIRGADDLISQLEKQMNEVFPTTAEGPVGRIKGALTRTIGAAAQTDVKASALSEFIKGTLAPFIRAMGEKGSLSDSDMARAKALLPKLTDSVEVANQKLSNLKAFFSDKYATTYGKTKPQTPDSGLSANRKAELEAMLR